MMRNLISKLNIGLILMSILLLTACMTEEQKRLKAEVEKTASECPLKVADGVTIDNITYADNVVTYNATVSTPVMTLVSLLGKQEQIKSGLLKLIKITKDSKVYEELKLCRDADATLRFELTDGTSTLSLDFSPEDIGDL